jgi:hypothetical protein|tara:strand:- start:1771 stop:2202 length:432 start_codon:yes stop_codon:yes gene_type:complete
MANKKIVESLLALGIEGWVLENDVVVDNETKFNANFKRVNGEDSTGTATYSTDPNDFGVTWKQISDAFADGGLVSLNILRKQRNALLTESDWTQTSDNALSSDKKTEWETYRQALRDLPAKAKPKLSDDAQSITNVTFPTKPS